MLESDSDADGWLSARTLHLYTYDSVGRLLTATERVDNNADGTPESSRLTNYSYVRLADGLRALLEAYQSQ